MRKNTKIKLRQICTSISFLSFCLIFHGFGRQVDSPELVPLISINIHFKNYYHYHYHFATSKNFMLRTIQPLHEIVKIFSGNNPRQSISKKHPQPSHPVELTVKKNAFN